MEETNWVTPDLVDGRIAPLLYQERLLRVLKQARLSGVPIRAVEAVCEQVYDGNHGDRHPKVFTRSGPLFIRNSYFESLNIRQFDHISDQDYDYLRTALKGVQYGDVFCAIKGDVGRAAVYYGSETRGTCNPPTACCRPGAQIDEGFLALQFESSFFLAQIRALANSKSTRPEVSVSEFKDLWVLSPKQMELQRAIGNKVRKARRLRELENIANQTFAGWLAEASHVRLLPATDCGLLEHEIAQLIRAGTVSRAEVGRAAKFKNAGHEKLPAHP